VAVRPFPNRRPLRSFRSPLLPLLSARVARQRRKLKPSARSAGLSFITALHVPASINVESLSFLKTIRSFFPLIKPDHSPIS
jgi:hypothetical protein